VTIGAVSCAGVAIAQKTIGRKGVHSLDAFNKVINVNLGGMLLS
jgi:3-hydroxyacyl-CoA dehydrogenase/3-hydroxy-2-methylbutyryl-CoA dehydrogenase